MASAVRRAGGTFLRQPALPPGLPCMIAKACGLENNARRQRVWAGKQRSALGRAGLGRAGLGRRAGQLPHILYSSNRTALCVKLKVTPSIIALRHNHW